MKKRHVVDLHGLTVQEALSKVMLAWDDAFENYCDELQVITGKGSGALKTSVEDMLIKEGHQYYEEPDTSSFIINITDEVEEDPLDSDKYN
ncbi:Smr/MutS family protein [Mycoplasmopsis adleri]|uniref:Smr/MutS family protein n=1 Tax=Mycoplasmopsis adleri TaxID=51362 RepID=UPI003873A5D8